MRFLTISSKICVSAAVFYSTFSLSECKAVDIPELTWRHDNEIVRIYRTELPWIPIELEDSRNNSAFMAWIAIISVVVCISCFVCLCCVCCKMCYRPRRHSANTALMPSAPPEGVVVFQTDPSADPRMQSSAVTTNNIYGNGVVNFAFTGRLHDPAVPYPPVDDGPPEYSAVVSQTPHNCTPANHAPLVPQASGGKTVETPPPAYLSVAPFQ